jgi:hypothetical protein
VGVTGEKTQEKLLERVQARREDHSMAVEDDSGM